MANEAQRTNWNGASGQTWVERQDQFDANNATWADLLLDVAALRPGEQVLDVGCGCGATTLAAARRVAPGGRAVGADLSEPMLEVARERAAEAGTAGEGVEASFVVADAQTDDLVGAGGPFDALISRFGVMFFDDPVAAFANLRTAVRPGGRLALAVWGPMEHQQWLALPLGAAASVLGPPEDGPGGPPMLSLGDRDHIVDLLTRAGWEGIDTALHERTMVLGGARTVEGAADFVSATGPMRALFADADPDTAARATDAIRAALQDHLTPEGVVVSGGVLAVTARR